MIMGGDRRTVARLLADVCPPGDVTEAEPGKRPVTGVWGLEWLESLLEFPNPNPKPHGA